MNKKLLKESVASTAVECLNLKKKQLEAPKIPSIFKARQPKSFNYKPFYYDAQKEERDQRNRWIKAESAISSEKRTDEFRSRLRARWEISNYSRRKNNASTFRLILIAAALFVITYLLLN